MCDVAATIVIWSVAIGCLLMLATFASVAWHVWRDLW